MNLTAYRLVRYMILRQIYNYFFGTKAKPIAIDFYLPTIPVRKTTIPPIGIIEFNELPYDDIEVADNEITIEDEKPVKKTYYSTSRNYRI